MPRLRLHQFNERHPCYFCGATGPSTKEHAPPKSFFDGTPCSSITVPACSQHNSDKARSDLAIKAALYAASRSCYSKGTAADMPNALRRSIEAMPEQYRRASGLVTMKPFVSDHPDDAGLQFFPFLHKSAQMESWVRMLTAVPVGASLARTNQDRIGIKPGFGARRTIRGKRTSRFRSRSVAP